MARGKSVLTTGEVARICKVAPRTVSKWFDSGQLTGYRIPGGKDRRIPIDQLVRFMHAHGIPLTGLDTGICRVLVLDRSPSATAHWQNILPDRATHEVTVVPTAFEAGMRIFVAKPHVLIVGEGFADLQTSQFADAVHAYPDLAAVKLACVRGADSAKAAQAPGFDLVILAGAAPDEVRAQIDRICT